MARTIRSDISRIPGEYIVAAMDLLPPCRADSPAQGLEVDAGIWGRFQVTFVPFRHAPRGRQPAWIWLAIESSERITIGQAGTEEAS